MIGHEISLHSVASCKIDKIIIFTCSKNYQSYQNIRVYRLQKSPNSNYSKILEFLNVEN